MFSNAISEIQIQVTAGISVSSGSPDLWATHSKQSWIQNEGNYNVMFLSVHHHLSCLCDVWPMSAQIVAHMLHFTNVCPLSKRAVEMGTQGSLSAGQRGSQQFLWVKTPQCRGGNSCVKSKWLCAAQFSSLNQTSFNKTPLIKRVMKPVVVGLKQ